MSSPNTITFRVQLHNALYKVFNFKNINIGVLSSRLLALKGVIKTFIFLDRAYVGQFARLT